MKNTVKNAFKNKIPKYLWPVLKLLFAGLLIYWMIKKGSLDLNSFKSLMDLKFIFVVTFVLIGMITLNNLRWWSLLKARGFAISFWESLSLTYIGIFFNFVIPGSVGGDFVKGYYVCKGHPERKMDASFTVILDRLIGIYAMINLSLLGVVMAWEKVENNVLVINIFYFFLFMSLISTVSFFVLVYLQPQWVIELQNNKIVKKIKLKEMISAVRSYKSNLTTLFNALIYSLCSQLMAVFLFMYIGYRLNESLSFEAYLYSVTMGFITSSVPVSPGGVGVGQVAFYFFFKSYTGEELQVGTVGISVMQVFMFLLGLIGGLMYLRGHHNKKIIGTQYD